MPRLDDADAGAVAGRDPRAAHPAGAAADHEQVEMLSHHPNLPLQPFVQRSAKAFSTT